MRVETELEEDGRWIAEVPALPGAMAYGATEEDAVAKVGALLVYWYFTKPFDFRLFQQ